MLFQNVMFGTYTRRQSSGIYQAVLDLEIGKLTKPTLLIQTGSPTYTVMSQAGFLYAVNRQNGQGPTGGLGGFNVYDFNNSGEPKKVQEWLTPDASEAYLAIDEKRQLLFAANYHLATLTIFKIKSDGTVTQTDQYTASGKGPRPEQNKAHIHFANLTPDGRLAIVDLGSDKVTIFDVTDDKLTLQNVFETGTGFGPRHMRFNPIYQNVAYVLGELSSLISVVKYDTDTAALILHKTYPTIPNDWTAHNGAAAIRVSHDGRFVYVSNRGHNSLAVFKVTHQGRVLDLVQTIGTAGDFPRDFNIDPSGQYIVVANQNTDNVTVFRRNQESGLLTKIQQDFPIPEGVRVMFY
ncbi:lactonase family protein [Leuconostoc citreum]|uniref:lactonase family protein n=1 Tax=Leuconostoc citreum TaxID=33964 RepID=UPI0021A91D65|nr:lactonase family protein [Leuconostoc citreum]MCT3069153.1 lactonase family protein [Leuconostoc citreum]